MVFVRKSDLWLSNSSSGGTDCYFSPLPVYWKKSMLEGGSSILFFILDHNSTTKSGKWKRKKAQEITNIMSMQEQRKIVPKKQTWSWLCQLKVILWVFFTLA
jgi:hypothetical protein